MVRRDLSQKEKERRLARLQGEFQLDALITLQRILQTETVLNTLNTTLLPIEVVFERIIDLLVLLSEFTKEGKAGPRLNKDISFSEDQQDSLGNPLQITTHFRRDFYKSAAFSAFILEVASKIITFKDNPKKPFMGFKDIRSVKSSQRDNKLNKNRVFYQLRKRRKRKSDD